MKNRCQWCGKDALYIDYHDNEWGVPVHDDRILFEFLILEGAQAGLSWITILKKRKAYRKTFDNFDYDKIAKYNDNDVKRLLTSDGIIRNKLKIKSVIKNARATLKVIKEFGSLNEYLWSFVEGQAIQNNWSSMSKIPAKTPLSEKMSKDLKKRGFNFVGPTICYSFMQATGMVNDHISECFRHKEVQELNN